MYISYQQIINILILHYNILYQLNNIYIHYKYFKIPKKTKTYLKINYFTFLYTIQNKNYQNNYY